MFLYKAILRRRAAQWRKAPGAAVPTVCVGNITVGGTGKTPHTEMILRLLGAGVSSSEHGDRTASAVPGYIRGGAPNDAAGGPPAPRLAVLSRGYKRKSKGFQYVRTDSSASFAGDEPLQIKRKFPEVTVAVDKDRVEGCRLLAEGGAGALGPAPVRGCAPHPSQADAWAPPSDGAEGGTPPGPQGLCSVIILDDAFQYHRLHADLNIVLVDCNRPIWKDCMLPFGRLRDLPERIADADIVIISKCPRWLEDERKQEIERQVRALAAGKDIPIFYTYIEYEAPKPAFADTDPHYSYAQSCILFTGIANDAPLMAYLSDKYKETGHIGFADHHSFSRGDIRRIARLAEKYPTAMIATTEKDAQRIRDCRDVPDVIRKRLFEVPIRAEFLEEGMREEFCRILLSLHKTEVL